MTKHHRLKHDWRKEAKHDLEFAMEQLIANGRVLPMFVIHTQDNDVHVIGVDWRSAAMKKDTALFIKLYCVATGAVAVSFISEAWSRRISRYANESKAEFQTRAAAIAPSEAEDRTEALIVQMLWRNERGLIRQHMEAAEIERGADGKPSRVKPIPWEKGETSGRFTELLPRFTPSAKEREIATEMLGVMRTVYGIHEQPVSRAAH